MKKQIEKIVFQKHEQKPIKFSEINVQLEPDDIIFAGYEEPECTENTGHDGYYYLQVIRIQEETDAQYEKRLIEDKKQLELMKARRFETYQRLKLEFES